MDTLKRLAKISLMTVGLGAGLTLATAQAATADTLELVQNGEFELGSRGWSTSERGFEVWGQSWHGSPALGSDGFGTGRHLEINRDRSNVTISQSFLTSKDLDGTAQFSFDAWKRYSGQGSYNVVGSLSGILASGNMNINNRSWTNHVEDIIFNPGEMITLNFNGRGSSASTPHIDQVSFLADVGGAAEAVPEPATLLGLFAIAGAAALKRKQTA